MTPFLIGTWSRLLLTQRRKLIACRAFWRALTTRNQQVISSLNPPHHLSHPCKGSHPPPLIQNLTRLWLRLTNCRPITATSWLWAPLLSPRMRRLSPRSSLKKLQNKSLRRPRRMLLRPRMQSLPSSRELLWPRRRLRKLRSRVNRPNWRESLKRRSKLRKKKKRDSPKLRRPERRLNWPPNLPRKKRSKRKRCSPSGMP